MIRIGTSIVCLCCVAITFAIFVVVANNYNPGQWASVIIFGGWDTIVYLGIIAAMFAFADSRRCSCVILASGITIGGFSLFALYSANEPFFIPPTPTGRVMNCAGPLVEIGLPFFQWPTLGLFVGTATLLRRFNRTKAPEDVAPLPLDG